MIAQSQILHTSFSSGLSSHLPKNVNRGSWGTLLPYSINFGVSASRISNHSPSIIFSKEHKFKINFRHTRSQNSTFTCQCADQSQGSSGIPQQEEDSSQVEQFGFALFDLMRASGLDTAHAQAARASFVREVAKAHNSRDVMATIDLARSALEIAAEDDALVTHSSVALPVDSYLERLDKMAAELANHHLPEQLTERTPEAVFKAMNQYIYGYKGFKRASNTGFANAQDFYLNGVLTRRVGTPVMLALIYSELASRLRHMNAIDFDVEMELPLDPISLPHPRVVCEQESGGGVSGDGQDAATIPSVVLTAQLLLYEVLRALKELYWPWRWHGGTSGGSGFVEAAEATKSAGNGLSTMGPAVGAQDRGAEAAAARSARYRLQRGIWTNTAFGDMRRALAACERLVILGVDEKDNRDYGALLYHCGLYRRAFSYLQAYSHFRDQQLLAPTRVPFPNALEAREGAALSSLLERLTLLVAELAWGQPDILAGPQEPLPEPW